MLLPIAASLLSMTSPTPDAPAALEPEIGVKSWLVSTMEKARLTADEPATNSKYKDAALIEHVITPSFHQVMEDVNMQSDKQVVQTFTLSLVADQQYYLLPPSIRRILRIVRIDDQGYVTSDWVPLSPNGPLGPGWLLNGNELEVRPTPTAADTFIVLYNPSGDVYIHQGIGTHDAMDATKFTLAATPTRGTLDMRPQAYAGQVLRILGSSDGIVQERVIASYDPATRIVTVRTPFSPTLATPGGASGINYEIAPAGGPSLWDAVGLKAGLRMMAFKGASASQMQNIVIEYQKSLKALRDSITTVNMRTGHRFQQDVYSNRDRIENNMIGWLAR